MLNVIRSYLPILIGIAVAVFQLWVTNAPPEARNVAIFALVAE